MTLTDMWPNTKLELELKQIPIDDFVSALVQLMLPPANPCCERSAFNLDCDCANTVNVTKFCITGT